MNEDNARVVTLLQAFETAQPPSPNWDDADRAWASRLALHEGAADAESFIVRRAGHALQRLAPREPEAARWLARPLWRPRWVGGAVGAGLVLGLLADSIGSSQRVNLLAPPLWAVLGWNATVYLLLLGHALVRSPRRRTPGVANGVTNGVTDGATNGVTAGVIQGVIKGGLLQLVQHVPGCGRGLPGRGTTGGSTRGSAPAWRSFAGLWRQRCASLAAARVATLLHAAAAALGLGLVGGLYLRGLVLDYRAGWESTFLSTEAAHAALAFVLTPAAALAGLQLPDAVAFDALRSVHGGASIGSSAALWIHLFALTLLLFVVLPRTALGLVGTVRARWLAARFSLPMGDAYFRDLARQLRGDVARVVVWPYASTPSLQAARGLQTLLAPALGDGMTLRIAGITAFGAEDAESAGWVGRAESGESRESVASRGTANAGHAAATFASPTAGTTLAVALFDLSATPEAESQGRFARRLAGHAPDGAATILLVDEAAFKQRFGADAARLVQRRDAWCALAETLGTQAVCVDLGALDAAAVRALQRALRRPIPRAAQ